MASHNFYVHGMAIGFMRLQFMHKALLLGPTSPVLYLNSLCAFHVVSRVHEAVGAVDLLQVSAV